MAKRLNSVLAGAVRQLDHASRLDFRLCVDAREFRE
jgi:hypothetical protein